jgi:hypothetical protein
MRLLRFFLRSKCAFVLDITRVEADSLRQFEAVRRLVSRLCVLILFKFFRNRLAFKLANQTTSFRHPSADSEGEDSKGLASTSVVIRVRRRVVRMVVFLVAVIGTFFFFYWFVYIRLVPAGYGR